jgi:aminobenzoyl-glutamate utilization protein A
MGLGLAQALLERKDALRGKVRLIFQPAEERYYGAQSIVDKGHLDDVENFISVHVALTGDGRPLPSKTICCGCKDFVSDCQLDVTFTGRAAHPCGASQEGKNALLAACTAALNLHSIAPHEAGLCRVNVGVLNAGVVVNTIAPNAFMSVEYRGQDKEISRYARRRVFDVLEGVSRSYDLEYSVHDWGEIPSSQSDDAMMEVVQRAAGKTPWFERIYFEGSVGGTDDAAVMMNKVQENGGIATYAGIGTDTIQPLHNPEFDLDEDAIPATIDMLACAIGELNGV